MKLIFRYGHQRYLGLELGAGSNVPEGYEPVVRAAMEAHIEHKKMQDILIGNFFLVLMLIGCAVSGSVVPSILSVILLALLQMGTAHFRYARASERAIKLVEQQNERTEEDTS